MGRAQELSSLYQQAMSYYSEIVAMRQDEQRQAAIQQQRTLQLFAIYGALAQQQQYIDAINRPRTCNNLNGVVTCR